MREHFGPIFIALLKYLVSFYRESAFHLGTNADIQIMSTTAVIKIVA